jgi:hypothetical protein
MTIQSLARYIREHGFDAYIRRGKLYGRMVYVTPEHKTLDRIEEIDPTFGAVRTWLGY